MYEKLVKQRFFKILANKVSYVTVDKQVFNFGLFWERSDLLVSLTLMESTTCRQFGLVP